MAGVSPLTTAYEQVAYPHFDCGVSKFRDSGHLPKKEEIMTPEELAQLEKKYMKYRYTASGQEILRLIAYTRELEKENKALKEKGIQ